MGWKEESRGRRRFSCWGDEECTENVRTAVYVDGFNLYYGALKGRPYRWLDLGRMCDLILKEHKVTRIRYFTAIVKPRIP